MSRADASSRRPWPLLVVAGLMLVVTVAALTSGPSATRLPVSPGTAASPLAPPTTAPRPGPTVTATPTGPVEGAELPGWLRAVVAGLVLVVAVVLVGGVVVLLRRFGLPRLGWRPATPPTTVVVTPRSEAAEVRAAVDAGIDELTDEATDPRQAVIGCWLRLERAAAAAGTPRQPDDTPADLVARMLASSRVSASGLAALAALYRRARYAPTEIDDSMRTEAQEMLARLRAELAAADASRPP